MFLSWVGFGLVVNLVLADEATWGWHCAKDNCQKLRTNSNRDKLLTSLGECQLLCCKHGSIWPKPTGTVSIGKNLIILNPSNIDIISERSEYVINHLIRSNSNNFLSRIYSRRNARSITEDGASLIVNFNISRPEITQLTLNLDEGYELRISQQYDDVINVVITADNYFGSRHGLETLGQIIVYDEIHNNLKIPNDAFINDKPVYTYRGLLLDTARNYISKEAIKRTIDGMSASKLNTFHWHLTDSHSFPYVSPSHPELSKIGAYSPTQIYSVKDIKEIVEFGQERGVRILPEFDAPAHVGEGWQDTDFTVCFNKQPWTDYCVEPPCGQFNPTKDKLYDFLEEIYGDLISQFNPDIFHMGGDEVNFACWNSSSEIKNWMYAKGWGTNEHDFVKLWDVFQSQALKRFDKQTSKQLPIILWSSTLTNRNHIEKYLPKDRYIIQIWTSADDSQLHDVLELGYNVILSNFDVLYLDCGVAAWVTDGSNWCSPYKGWQKIYENSPAKIGGTYKDQILGAEAALWTEQVDDAAVDSRIWPRAAALGERLWSEPETGWEKAEQRMLIHRQRLVGRGIRADAIEPQWCMQNQQSCPIKKTY